MGRTTEELIREMDALLDKARATAGGATSPADREEPFWKAAMLATEDGGTVNEQPPEVRKRVAMIAMACGMKGEKRDE